MSNNMLDILSSLNTLDEKIKIYEASIFKEISEIANQLDIEIINDKTHKIQKIKIIQLQLANVKDELLKLNSNSDIQKTTNTNYNTRTLDNNHTFEWEVKDSNIRTISRRPDNTYYSNLLPILLFSDITKQSFLIYKQNGYITSGEIDKILRDKIIRLSNYSDSKSLISKALKILVFENIIIVDPSNSRKYLFNVKDVSKINNWLEKLQHTNGYVPFYDKQ